MCDSDGMQAVWGCIVRWRYYQTLSNTISDEVIPYDTFIQFAVHVDICVHIMI